MKNKVGLLAISVFAVISLTSCQFLYSLLEGDSESGGYIYHRSSEEEISSDVMPSSVPEAGDLEAKSPSVNYMDFVTNNAYPISSTPCVGTAKLLVIPVWFTDSHSFILTNKRDTVRSDIQTAYFGSNEDTGWRSVKTYYEEESFNALSLTGIVSEWYECGASYRNYTKDADTSKTVDLVTTATDWYFTNHTDNKTDYDCDHDGYLDGVMLIYAAPDYGTLRNDNYDNLWAYCFWTQDYTKQNPANPALNAFFWASYDFMYGANARDKAGYSYAGGDTSHCNIDAHTFIHEMGHMFGLEDYYDYSSKSYDPAGSFSMQDHNVGGHDAFSVYALGWGKAYIPTESTTIDLKPLVSSGEVIVLSPSFNNYNSPFDEYLLLEYYVPTGLNEFDTTHQYQSRYPTGSKQAGIRLWHVDARLIYTATGNISASQMTTNPRTTAGRILYAMTNTYDDGKDATKDYLSMLGQGYYNYNLLQMIRNNATTTYYPSLEKDALSASNLFRAGSSFSMSDFSRQFVNRGKLNSNKDLGFTFTVNGLDSTHASITVNKL